MEGYIHEDNGGIADGGNADAETTLHSSAERRNCQRLKQRKENRIGREIDIRTSVVGHVSKGNEGKNAGDLCDGGRARETLEATEEV